MSISVRQSLHLVCCKARLRSFFACVFLLAALNPAARGAAADSLSLRGAWRFALDRDDVGEREAWFNQHLDATIRLPGALQAQGFGDDISTNTAWTGSLNDRSWFTADRYAPYREPGNVKVPFWLQPAKHYVGAAWYQRDVQVPASWAGRRIVLQLERPHWCTTLWLDGQLVGRQDSLGVPHEYDLGIAIAPGKHRLTLRIDNRVLIAVGKDAHSVSDHTQGNWNGVAGDLKLLATEPVWIDDIRAFPRVSTRTVQVRVTFGNATRQPGAGTLDVRTAIHGASTRPPAARQIPVHWTADGGTTEFTLELGPDAPLWDEFLPALHELTLQIHGITSPKAVTFGLREVRGAGTQLTVNDRPIFLRGTLECCIFPLTGYPPTDVASWKRILRIAREHGLNHLRFHSWCPPEAAFVAGDEMGFYYQVECSAWSLDFNKGTPFDTWIYAESERMVKAYGNHPSFLLMAPSNEPAGPEYESFLARFVEYWKANDRRRLYTAGSGWPSIAANEYHVTHGARAYPVHSAQNGRNATDYRDFLARQNRPVISHEIGQYCVFPNLDEIPKYRGLFRARNFEIVRDFLAQAGMTGQARDFLRASGRLQTLFYKEEIEACLRTPGWGGFQLLDLHDFPGQGTALIGVLDPFWDEKGYVKPAEFRRFCDQTVPLSRLAKRLWTTDETLRATIEVAHAGPRDLPATTAHWILRDTQQGRTVAKGVFPARSLPTGKLTALGEVEVPLDRFTQATALNLEVSLEGTRFVNDWNCWAYPSSSISPTPTGVTVTSTLDDTALNVLASGGRVVVLADPQTLRGATTGRFDPIFWNRLWFPSQPQHTLGLLMDPKHPALAEFPTAFHADWQWQDLQNRSKPIVLDALPRELRPVVQVIDDWNTCRKLGLVIEARVGKGRILICSVDLSHDLQTRPAARQLRRSLLDYAASPRFHPKTSVNVDQMRSLFREPGLAKKLGARVIRADSAAPDYAASLILDGDPKTFWHTPWGDQAPGFPHEIVIALERPATLHGLSVLPRQDGQNGWIQDYAVYLSLDGEAWGEAVAQGRFTQNPAEKEILFARPANGRFLKFVARSAFESRQPFASLAELELIGSSQ